MALIQLGALVTGVRNSVKGSTYSQNKGGAYVKGKPIPANPRSSAQTIVRTNFAANAKLWSGTLTDAERAAWNFFAAANPYTNVFGEVKQLSGMAMMMKLNQVLAQVGASVITTPPTDLSVPPLAALTGLTAVRVGTALSVLQFVSNPQTVQPDAQYYIFATPPLQGGKKASTSDFRYVGVVSAAGLSIAVDFLANYVAVFPGAVPNGSHISVLGAGVSLLSGAVTPAVKFDTGAF